MFYLYAGYAIVKCLASKKLTWIKTPGLGKNILKITWYKIVYISYCFHEENVHVFHKNTQEWLKQNHHRICSAPVCKVLNIDGGYVDVSACFTPLQCKVNTTLRYVCQQGFVQSSTTTTCLPNHTWSTKPSCEKGMPTFPI